MKKFFWLFAALLVVVVGFYFAGKYSKSDQNIVDIAEDDFVESTVNDNIDLAQIDNIEETVVSDARDIQATVEKNKILPKFVHHQVPFTSQAPFGDWSDDRFQDGCEEASMIMANYWLKGKNLDPHTAAQEILNLSKWEQDKYGTYHDTSAKDSSNTLQQYFSIDAGVNYDVTVNSIKQVLAEGGIVLVPSNGAILLNPNYSSPPPHHMVVVVGYDDKNNEFIVNDPGTKHGEAYRYAFKTVIAAAQDYPTGDHLVVGDRPAAMLTVYPQ